MSDTTWMAKLAGSWSGTVETWLDPAAPPLENTIRGTFRRALDGPSVTCEYQSSVGSDRSDGLMVLGKDVASGHLCLIWIDTFHTGSNVMLFGAEAHRSDGAFSGAWAAGEEMWRWRITFRFVSDDELAIAHVNIQPNGTETRAIEIRYRRSG